jgi:hypothetical protein
MDETLVVKEVGEVANGVVLTTIAYSILVIDFVQFPSALATQPIIRCSNPWHLLIRKILAHSLMTIDK